MPRLPGPHATSLPATTSHVAQPPQRLLPHACRAIQAKPSCPALPLCIHPSRVIPPRTLPPSCAQHSSLYPFPLLPPPAPHHPPARPARRP